MREILPFILLLLLAGCGRDNREFKNIDPAFDSYIEHYETSKGSSIGDIGIGFKKLNGPTVGVCIRTTSGHREIHVDPDFWMTANEIYRTTLIFHELGHCDLGRSHDDSILKSGHNKSLMNTYLFAWDSEDMKEYYFDELFNR